MTTTMTMTMTMTITLPLTGLIVYGVSSDSSDSLSISSISKSLDNSYIL